MCTFTTGLGRNGTQGMTDRLLEDVVDWKWLWKN